MSAIGAIPLLYFKSIDGVNQRGSISETHSYVGQSLGVSFAISFRHRLKMPNRRHQTGR